MQFLGGEGVRAPDLAVLSAPSVETRHSGDRIDRNNLILCRFAHESAQSHHHDPYRIATVVPVNRLWIIVVLRRRSGLAEIALARGALHPIPARAVDGSSLRGQEIRHAVVREILPSVTVVWVSEKVLFGQPLDDTPMPLAA
jgi:hypothetical protein